MLEKVSFIPKSNHAFLSTALLCKLISALQVSAQNGHF